MTVEIRGRNALVTGGGAGIGRAISERLAGEGAAVLVADRDPAAARAAADAILAAGGRAALAVADLASERGVRGALRACDSELGPLDILVNNAGGVDEPCYPDAPLEQWSRAIDLNLRSPMLAAQLAIDVMCERGEGAIVNVASMAGIGFAPHGAPEYAAAKAGLVRLTAALGGLATAGVRVNCICPGWVDTPASRRTRASMSEEQRRTAVPAVLLTPAQIADVAVMLIRDDTLAGRVLIWPDGEHWRLLDPARPGATPDPAAGG